MALRLLCCMTLCWFLCLVLAATKDSIHEPALEEHYGSFKVPRFTNTTFEAVKEHLLRGLPLVVEDGAKGLEMASWDCDYVRKTFPGSLIRQEGGKSEVNAVPMESDWPQMRSKFPLAKSFPEGAPQYRPFYWDIVKAFRDEPERKWGKNPSKVAEKLVAASRVPYFLPPQEADRMGYSSEMWFHPKGAGAAAHMDPQCETKVSFCFSGHRKWRMMLPPPEPHRNGFYDGEVYGARDPSRQGEWNPTFEFEAPAGSAVIVYPGMIHETVSTGEACSSSITQDFKVPVAAAYYRSFWPRFSLIHEDVGRCSYLVEDMVALGSRIKVPPAKVDKARAAAQKFAVRVDADADGIISLAEIKAVQKSDRLMEELVSFHDVDADRIVTKKELEDSWVMFASAQHRLRMKQKRGEL